MVRSIGCPPGQAVIWPVHTYESLAASDAFPFNGILRILLEKRLANDQCGMAMSEYRIIEDCE
jgi:hypothetical protein